MTFPPLWRLNDPRNTRSRGFPSWRPSARYRGKNGYGQWPACIRPANPARPSSSVRQARERSNQLASADPSPNRREKTKWFRFCGRRKSTAQASACSRSYRQLRDENQEGGETCYLGQGGEDAGHGATSTNSPSALSEYQTPALTPFSPTLLARICLIEPSHGSR